jgi:hypothetical protein
MQYWARAWAMMEKFPDFLSTILREYWEDPDGLIGPSGRAETTGDRTLTE